MPKKVVHTKIEGRELKLSNLQKVLYPNDGITKAEVIEYALTMSDRILQFAKQRPLTLIRYPDGVNGLSFYSKNTPDHTPDWITKSHLPWDKENLYSRLQTKADVIYFANLAALEVHVTNTRFPTIQFPDHFVIDIDPSESVPFEKMVEIGFEIRSFLELRGFASYVKTSGSKGIHILIPLMANTPSGEVMTFFKKLLKNFVASHPITTLDLSKEKRKGKMFLDLLRNHQGNTTVTAWSLRARPEASLSMPLEWEMLKEIDSSKFFTLSNYREYQSLYSVWDNMESDQVSIVKSKPKALKEYKPMLASPTQNLPKGDNYIYEVKWDGIRVLIIKSGKQVLVRSRSGRDISSQFKELCRPEHYNCQDCVIDGEVVVLDDSGRPLFSEVISRLHSKQSSRSNAICYAFDCLNIDGADMVSKNLESRREALKSIIIEGTSIRFSQSFEDGQQLFDAISLQEMEGIMLKKKGSKYTIGARSAHWLKLKVRKDATCYIIGYTEGSGDRSPYFGSLVLGIKEKETWIYMGRVGTGFDTKLLEFVKSNLDKISLSKKLISEKIEEERKTTWIEPRLKCEINYASMSSNNTYREPVFKTLIF